MIDTPSFVAAFRSAISPGKSTIFRCFAMASAILSWIDNLGYIFSQESASENSSIVISTPTSPASSKSSRNPEGDNSSESIDSACDLSIIILLKPLVRCGYYHLLRYSLSLLRGSFYFNSQFLQITGMFTLKAPLSSVHLSCGNHCGAYKLL